MNTAEKTHEPTIANADLWTRYFQDQWSPWLNFGREPQAAAVAEGTAARVAGFLTLVAAGPIAWLCSSNTSNVTALREEPVKVFAADELESIEESAA